VKELASSLVRIRALMVGISGKRILRLMKGPNLARHARHP
jgi:hypothetical protein